MTRLCCTNPVTPVWWLDCMNRPNTPACKTQTWPAYNKALRRRGSLAIWFDPDMVWGRSRQASLGDSLFTATLLFRPA